MNEKYKKYLPLGSVVLMKGAKKRVMITGFAATSPETKDKVWDYIGCMWPEGVISADKNLLFDHKNIDKIYALGYVDEETVHISARGGKKVNVGKIMEQAYGGGNFQSAGGRVVTDDITAVENLLMEKVPIGVSDEEEIIENPPVVKKVKQMKKKKYRL